MLGETRFTWDGLRLLQEQKNGLASLYVYLEDSYEPLARVDGSGDTQRIRHYHNDLNGLPGQLTDHDGQTVWRAQYQVWGNTLREPYYVEEQNLRFQGQYLDRDDCDRAALREDHLDLEGRQHHPFRCLDRTQDCLMSAIGVDATTVPAATPARR